MNSGEIIHGFRVIDKTYVAELSCDVYTMEHERCGAKLIFIDREDDNKTFSIAFKTLPEDSTGVFHIIEHSVLCGSEKYPLKDPFVELLKGSLNTFLNAMTFQDKTMYPVASRNDRDFLNLVGIYLDATLRPLVMKDPNAFYQEGWHYELDSEGKSLSYKGVVLNEMRGEYSTPETVADRHLNDMLYEGTPYAEDSGGDPACIPELTYEGFRAAYSKYYDPSRAYLFLDGSVDLDSTLPLIDSYFADCDHTGPDLDIPYSKINAPKSRTVSYETKPGEDPENKARLCEGFIISRYDEQERIIAANILLAALFSNNESPAKKAIVDSGLCEDVSTAVHDGILEPSAVFEFVNVRDGAVDELRALFTDTLSTIIRDGIDKDELLATINSVEFKMREKDYGTLPLGIAHAMITLESLLYSDDPVQNFRYEEAIKSLREKVNTDYYEQLLGELFIDNPKRATVIMTPSSTLAEEREAAERAALDARMAELTDAQISELAEMNARLLEWQEKDDSDEAKASIPALALSDIPATVTRTPIEVTELDGVRVISHDLATAGIVYADLYFDITDISREELAVLSLFNILITNLPTEKHSAVELQRMIKGNLGGIELRMTALTEGTTPKIYLQVSASALDSQRGAIADISAELLNTTLFDDHDAIRNILRQTVISNEESFASVGHQVALGRAAAATSVEAAAREYYSGYEAYVRLKQMDAEFDVICEELSASLRAIAEKYITRQRLTVSITGKVDDTLVRELIGIAKNGDKVTPVCNITTIPKRKEGILIPAQVAFAVTSYNIAELGETPTGSLDVTRTLVGFEYLWGAIRVRGGAYGAGMLAGISGTLGFYSYRDPTPARTLGCYTEVAEFLRSFAREGRDITKYIIGAVGDADPVRTPRLRGSMCTVRYLRGISYEQSCEIRRKMLATDADELVRIADIIEKCVARGAVCVVGGKEKLDSIPDLDEILRI